MTTKKDQIRYNLHYRLRKEGHKIDSKNRVYYQKHNLPLPVSRHLKRLVKEFNYSIQLVL